MTPHVHTSPPDPPPPGENFEARRARATRLAHVLGDIVKMAVSLVSPASSSGNDVTQSILRSKHPCKNLRDIQAATVKSFDTSQ